MTEPFLPLEAALVRIGRALRERVVRAHRGDRDRRLAAPDHDGVADMQYAIDRVSEEGLVDLVAAELASWLPLRLLSEGLPAEGVVIAAAAPTPASASPTAPAWRVVIDPIDGTRGLMHDKRSAFVLIAIAPERAGVSLRDVQAAAMVEVPHTRSDWSDVFGATRGGGVRGVLENIATGSTRALAPSPDRSISLAHGFATFPRYIPGAFDRIGALAEDFFDRAFAGDAAGRAAVFEDQFISSAGQQHALLTGRDRLVADVRPMFMEAAARAGRRVLPSHPYDMLATLILEEAGLPVTGLDGQPLNAPLELAPDVAWIGWANAALRARHEPALFAAITAARQALSGS